jgi:hypothetical protein
VKFSHVDYLAGCISRGEWLLTHQGIAFAPDGRLLDGQHRLMAIVKSGLPVQIQVSMGVQPDTFDVIDTGSVKRSASDVLHVPFATTAVAVMARKLVVGSFSSGTAVSAQQLRPYVERFGPLIEELEDGGGQNGTRLLRNSHIRLAGILAATNGDGMDYVNPLYRNLVKRNYDQLPPVAIALIRRIDLRDLVSHPTNPELLICARRVFSRKHAANTKLLVRDKEPRLAEMKAEVQYVMGGGRE